MPAMRKATIACIVEGHGEVQAQAAFAAVFDMKAAREKSPSFDKFWREAERLLRG
jgi:hypothetical protein